MRPESTRVVGGAEVGAPLFTATMRVAGTRAIADTCNRCKLLDVPGAMRKYDDYYCKADDCLQRALAAPDEAHRVLWLRAAKSWLDMIPRQYGDRWLRLSGLTVVAPKPRSQGQ